MVQLNANKDTLLQSLLTHLERPEPEPSQIKSVVNWMDGKKPIVRAESTFLNDWSDLKSVKQSTEKGGLEVLIANCAVSPRLRCVYQVGLQTVGFDEVAVLYD